MLAMCRYLVQNLLTSERRLATFYSSSCDAIYLKAYNNEAPAQLMAPKVLINSAAAAQVETASL